MRQSSARAGERVLRKDRRNYEGVEGQIEDSLDRRKGVSVRSNGRKKRGGGAAARGGTHGGSHFSFRVACLCLVVRLEKSETGGIMGTESNHASAQG